jgi:glycosyltransferase 2 family protein
MNLKEGFVHVLMSILKILMSRFKLLKWILQIIVTVFLLYITFLKLDVVKLKEIVSGMNKLMILPVLVLLFLDLLMNSYRLMRLYRFYDVETKLFRIMLIRFYSLFFTLIFPFLGDAYKIKAFKNTYGASYGKNTLVVVLDKLIHSFALIIIVAPLWAFNEIHSGFNLHLVLWGLLILHILLIVFLNMPQLVRNIFEKLGKINTYFQKIQFHYVRRPNYFKEIVMNTGISSLRHIMMGFLHVLIAYAIFHRIDFNVFLFLLIVFLIMIAQVIPLSVGGIGLREYIAVMIFPAIGISSESAFMIAFIISSIVIMQGIAGGMTYLAVHFIRVKK